MTRMQRGVTRAVINTNRMATVAFIKNPDLQTPWVAMEEGVRDVDRRRRDAIPRRHAHCDGVARRFACDQHLPARLRVSDGAHSRVAPGPLQGDRAQRRRGGRQPARVRVGTARLSRSGERRAPVASRRDRCRQRSRHRARPRRRHRAPRRFPHRLSGRRTGAALPGAGRSRSAHGIACGRWQHRADRRRRPQLLQAAGDQGRVRSRATVHRRRIRAAGRGGVRRRLHAALSLRAAALGEARQGDGRAGEAHLWRMDASGAQGAREVQGRSRHVAGSVRPHGGAPAGTATHRRL